MDNPNEENLTEGKFTVAIFGHGGGIKKALREILSSGEEIPLVEFPEERRKEEFEKLLEDVSNQKRDSNDEEE